jgi:hypothetical protein
MARETQAADLIRLDLYPLENLASPHLDDVIARAKADLDRQQYCVLPNFITESARADMAAEAVDAMPQAHINRSRRTCFLNQKPSPDRPADHPMNVFFDARFHIIAFDQFDPDGPTVRFYGWEPIRRMIARIVGTETLYMNEDPYQPTVVIGIGDGDTSPWHFDRGNAFTVTLMLQEPEEGGAFEIAPEIWPGDDTDPAELLEVLHGHGGDRVLRVERVPSSLVIFRGNRSVHRVTEAKGKRMRLMSVMSYEDRPGVIGRPEVNASVFGPRVLEGSV